MSSDLFILAGPYLAKIEPTGGYSIEIEPAAQIRGVITDFGDGPYEMSLNYYNQTVVFSTRPTVDDGSIGEQPGFS